MLTLRSPLLVFSFFVCFGVPLVSGASPYSYPGHPTNWVIRAGGQFGQDEDNVSPGAPYMAMKFYPADVEIFNFDTVTWVFNTTEPHTVSFINGFTVPIDPLDQRIFALQQPIGGTYFDNTTSDYLSSGLRSSGDPNYILTFNQTGTFPYLCALHTYMNATLRVRDWNQTLGKSPDDVIAQANDQFAADSTYALGDFIKQANLLGPVQYTNDPDGYRTWTVFDGISAQPSDSGTSGVGPISAYDFYPGNGVFNISKGDRIKFINADVGIHSLGFQTNDTFIPFEGGNYLTTYVPDSQLTYTGGFQDYGILYPFLDPSRDNKTITFNTEGAFFVFCTIHASLGMHAQINVLPENGLGNNGTGTTNGTSTGSESSSGAGGAGGAGGSGGSGGTGGTGGGAGTGTGTNPSQSSTGVSGGGGGSSGNGNPNSDRATATYRPAMVLAISLLLGCAMLMI